MKPCIKGERVRELRKQLGYGPEEFSDMCAISSSTLRGIENNRDGTSVNVLVLIAHNLDCTTDYLLGRDKALAKLMECCEPLPPGMDVSSFA